MDGMTMMDTTMEQMVEGWMDDRQHNRTTDRQTDTGQPTVFIHLFIKNNQLTKKLTNLPASEF